MWKLLFIGFAMMKLMETNLVCVFWFRCLYFLALFGTQFVWVCLCFLEEILFRLFYFLFLLFLRFLFCLMCFYIADLKAADTSETITKWFESWANKSDKEFANCSNVVGNVLGRALTYRSIWETSLSNPMVSDNKHKDEETDDKNEEAPARQTCVFKFEDINEFCRSLDEQCAEFCALISKGTLTVKHCKKYFSFVAKPSNNNVRNIEKELSNMFALTNDYGNNNENKISDIKLLERTTSIPNLTHFGQLAKWISELFVIINRIEMQTIVVDCTNEMAKMISTFNATHKNLNVIDFVFVIISIIVG